MEASCPKHPHPLEPKAWGTAAWKFLHACSFSYPDVPSEAQKNAARRVFESIGEILPCPICKGHYNDHLKSNPPRVSSKQELSRWLVDIHNAVNTSRGESVVEYDTVRRHYEENSHELDCDCPRTSHYKHKLLETKKLLSGMTIVMIILLIVLFTVIGLNVLKKKR